MPNNYPLKKKKSECDHRTRISSICRDLDNAYQRRRQAATKAAPPTSPKRVSDCMQAQPAATTALGFRQFAETSAMRTNKGGKQPPRLRRRRRLNAAATGCKLRLLSLPRNPSATTALGFRRFAIASAMRTNEGGKQPPRLRRRRRPNASAIACRLSLQGDLHGVGGRALAELVAGSTTAPAPRSSVRSSRMRPT